MDERPQLTGPGDPSKSEDLESTHAKLAAEWDAYELASLNTPPAGLLSNTLDRFELAAEELATADTSATPLTAVEIKSAALNRNGIRKAIVAYGFGGAIRLFEAYEEINYEIMDGAPNQAPDGGPRQWMINRGWITDDQENRFLNTLKYRCNETTPDFVPYSPSEAERFVRNVVLEFIRYCVAQTTNDGLQR
jgi:hypothetical protein